MLITNESIVSCQQFEMSWNDLFPLNQQVFFVRIANNQFKTLRGKIKT